MHAFNRMNWSLKVINKAEYFGRCKEVADERS